jgi:hypothetical protein
MAEITTFYQAMLPRMEEVLSYLAQYTSEQVPADVQRLFYLTLSLAKIAPAVEMYGVLVEDGGRLRKPNPC